MASRLRGLLHRALQQQGLFPRDAQTSTRDARATRRSPRHGPIPVCDIRHLVRSYSAVRRRPALFDDGAALHDEGNIFQQTNIRDRICLHRDQVRIVAWFERPDPGVPDVVRRKNRRGLDGLH